MRCAVALLLAVAACAGKSTQSGPSGAPAGAAGAGGSAASGAGGQTTAGAGGAGQGTSGDAGMGVPIHHRPAHDVCPAERGAVTPVPQMGGCEPDSGTCPDECQQDSDCTQGTNGRCGFTAPLPVLRCSYDQCDVDADCSSQTPCICRASADSPAANYCAPAAGCQLDSECGAGGYCSPSFLDQWCGTVYHCHTPADTCLDDSDCTLGGLGSLETCNFDPSVQHWVCNTGCGPPPP